MAGQIVFAVVMLVGFRRLEVHQARQEHLRQVDRPMETIYSSREPQSSIASMDGKRPTPIVRDAHALLVRGIDALERNHIDEAVGLLRQTVELDAESFHGHLALGIALTKALEIPAAEQALETAIGLEPKNFYAHLRMARVVSARRRADEGERRIADRAGSRADR